MSLVELRNIIQSYIPYNTQETQDKKVMLDISILLLGINSHPYTLKHIIHSFIYK